MSEPGAVKVMRFSFSVPFDHPALPGHFPGSPVVPGVIVLDQVLSHAGQPAGKSRRLAWVKFLRPLLPGQTAVVTLSGDRAGLRFTVSHEDDVLVQGVLAQ